MISFSAFLSLSSAAFQGFFLGVLSADFFFLFMVLFVLAGRAAFFSEVPFLRDIVLPKSSSSFSGCVLFST